VINESSPFRRWIIAGFGCLVLLLVLAGYKFMQIRNLIAFAASFPELSETVEVVSVAEQSRPETVSTTGEVVSPQSLDVRTEIAGKIVAVGFAAGEMVKQGQVLLQLDVTEEQAQWRAAQAESALLQLDLERYQKLMLQKVSSKDQYDHAKAQYEMAVARAQALQAVIEKKTVRAPFDARAGLHVLQVGQYLAANTQVTHLVGVSPDVWVDFNLPQQNAGLPIGVAVWITGNTGQILSGTVIASEAVVATASRNMRFRALLPAASTQLKPGQMVKVAVTVAPDKKILVIPSVAMHYDTEGAYVFTLKTDDTKHEIRAATRRVVAAQEKDQSVVVLEGLQAGEKIAATGSYKLKENTLIHVSANAAPPVH
jgi:membrane fusion protein (multidrug efflux system)